MSDLDDSQAEFVEDPSSPQMVPKKDKSGNPVLDKDGNQVMVKKRKVKTPDYFKRFMSVYQDNTKKAAVQTKNIQTAINELDTRINEKIDTTKADLEQKIDKVAKTQQAEQKQNKQQLDQMKVNMDKDKKQTHDMIKSIENRISVIEAGQFKGATKHSEEDIAIFREAWLNAKKTCGLYPVHQW